MHTSKHIIILLHFVAMLIATKTFAQKHAPTPYWGFDERKLIETKWKYDYTFQRETNTVLHKAGKDYKFFLYFRYNHTYHQYLNGEFSRGQWAIHGPFLIYSFNEVDSFRIVALNKSSLVLEFQQPGSKAHYQYSFSRVSSDKAPFAKPLYELPDVIVEAKAPRRSKFKSWFARLFSRRRHEKDRINLVGNGKYISIELAGGGYYGGVNPVIRDYIHIKSDGRLVKEFKSLKGGLQVSKGFISRAELEQFMDYVESQGFWKMKRLYDCEDATCAKRKKKRPKPIPLRLVIAYGSHRKIVTITVWGLDKNNMQYVPVPEGLNNIIYAIQEMGNRFM